jgi:hypothetical protein
MATPRVLHAATASTFRPTNEAASLLVPVDSERTRPTLAAETIPASTVFIASLATARHASPAAFVHKDHHYSTLVFLRQDVTRRALKPPYSDPYQALSWREKMLQLLVRSKPVTVSAGRVKPAYVLNEIDRGSTTFNSSANTTPAAAPPPPPANQTTRSGRHVRFPT